jgi:UDP-N-acetylmuramate--alanine ligase
MNLRQETYFFLGIGGIGMSALARYCFLKGAKVGGYDATPSAITADLEALGMELIYSDHISILPDTFKHQEAVKIIYTPAVPKTTALFEYFSSHKFSIIKRATLLGAITADSFSYAIGGTHGKTTTSSLLAHLLDASGVGITAFLGGLANNFNSNLLLKDTTTTVVEADEFDRSFLTLSPNVACITGTDADHLDIYKNAQSLEEAFEDFAKRVKPTGRLFVHESVQIPGTTYGLLETSDYYLSEICYEHGNIYAHLHTPKAVFKRVLFPMPGTHNLLNALVAFAMAESQGVAPEKLIAALVTFKGVARRFSYEIKKENRVFIDDYAHHPTAIKAVFESLKTLYPKELLTVVFQPHLYSRTQDFAAEFASSLSLFNCVYLLDIYPARELPIDGVNSSWLLEKITAPEKALLNKKNLVERIVKINPKILVTLGAGDIGLEVPKIKAALL